MRIERSKIVEGGLSGGRGTPRRQPASHLLQPRQEIWAPVIGLCDITQGLTDQLGQIERGGFFDDGRTGAAFLPAITDLHAAGANPRA
jgi:hypothetical protein